MRIRKESRESPSQCLFAAVVIGWPTFQVEEHSGRRVKTDLERRPKEFHLALSCSML